MNIQLLWLSMFLISFATPPVRAAFILDDFDDRAQIFAEGSIDTVGVGELNADRHLGIGASQADLVGTLDADVTGGSLLTANVTGLSGNIGLPIVSFNTSYTFTNPTDFTEAGRNDAFLIDVMNFQGPGFPDFLRVTFRDANGIFFAVIPGSQLLTDDRLTVVVPFSAFGPRGGGTENADPSTIDLVEVLVRLTTGFSDPNQHWFVQIDRISLGRIVPEPATGWIAILTVLFVAALRIWRF